MSGQITRKEIIEDEALQWGPEYAKHMQSAIDKNKEFVQSILAMNAANKELRNSGNAKELEANSKKVNELSAQTTTKWKEQDQAEKALISTKRKLELATESTNRALVKERLLLQETNKEVKLQARETLGLVGTYEKLNKARNESQKRLADLLSAEKQNVAEIKNAQKEFKKLDVRVKAVDVSINNYSKNIGNYSSAFKGLNKTAGEVFATFGLVTGVALLGTVFNDAMSTIKEFDQAIADLSSITGASGKDLEYLKNQAVLLGRETEGGAVQVVEAYKLIASAKPELLENVEALNQVTEAVLTLSQAAGMELPDAATALTDAMNQFGADASRATVFVDTLANGAKYGAAEIPQITDALLKFGAVARSTNVSIGESTALIEVLAENGLKGADAGTALRNVLLKLSAPDALPEKAQKAIKELGISFEFLKDKSVPIQAKLEALKPVLKDNADIVRIFGLENAVAATNILEHTDRLQELTKKMNESGTAGEQAAIRMNTLQGSFSKLESAYDSFILSLNDRNTLGSALKFVTDQLTSTVEGWRKIFTSNEKLKEEELASIRKQGFDSIAKSYSDTNKFNDGQLEIIKNRNSEEIKENAKKVNELIALNETLSKKVAKTPLGDIISKEDENKIRANLKTIAEINKLSTSLVGKNEGISSMINSRKSVGTTPELIDENQNKESLDAIKKAADDRLKLLKKSYDAERKLNEDAYKLRQFNLQVAMDVESEIIANENTSFDERIEALLFFGQLREAKNRESYERDLQLLGAYNEKTGKFVRELSDEEIKSLLDTGATKGKLTDEQALKYKQYQNELTNDSKKGEADRRKLINSEVEANKRLIDSKIQDQTNKQNVEVIDANNIYSQELAVAGDNFKLIEAAREKHEKAILEIQKRYALEGINAQISNIEQILEAQKALPEDKRLSNDLIKKYEDDLLAFKLQASNLAVENDKKNATITVEQQKDLNEKLVDLAISLKDALTDLTNAIFDARISNIDAEIERNNEFYDGEIEKAGNNDRQKSLLEAERDKKNAELEKKRKKEAYKAAVFNKVMALAQIALNLAQTISAINLAAATIDAVSFGIGGNAYRGFQIPFAIGIAAVQAATVLATPLPKYKHGRKNGPDEFAVVGDGGRPEVISDSDGSNPRITPGTPTLTFLRKKERVHKSLNDYKEHMRNAFLSDLQTQHNAAREYSANINVNNDFSELEKKIESSILEGFKKVKNNVNVNVNSKSTDLNHELWKMGNTNWKK